MTDPRVLIPADRFNLHETANRLLNERPSAMSNLSPSAIDALKVLAAMGDRGAVTLSHNSLPAPGSNGKGEACVHSSNAAGLVRKGLASSAPRFDAGHRFADSTQLRITITEAGVAALAAHDIEVAR